MPALASFMFRNARSMCVALHTTIDPIFVISTECQAGWASRWLYHCPHNNLMSGSRLHNNVITVTERFAENRKSLGFDHNFLLCNIMFCYENEGQISYACFVHTKRFKQCALLSANLSMMRVTEGVRLR